MFGILRTNTEKIEETENTYAISYVDGVNTDPGDETALIIDESCFILNGNWIDEYRNCDSKEKQVELFKKKYEKHGGFWTQPVEKIDEAAENHGLEDNQDQS